MSDKTVRTYELADIRAFTGASKSAEDMGQHGFRLEIYIQSKGSFESQEKAAEAMTAAGKEIIEFIQGEKLFNMTVAAFPVEAINKAEVTPNPEVGDLSSKAGYERVNHWIHAPKEQD